VRSEPRGRKTRSIEDNISTSVGTGKRAVRLQAIQDEQIWGSGKVVCALYWATTVKQAAIQHPLMDGFVKKRVSMPKRGYSNRGCVFYIVHLETL
jgi:hypothetical protein